MAAEPEVLDPHIIVQAVNDADDSPVAKVVQFPLAPRVIAVIDHIRTRLNGANPPHL